MMVCALLFASLFAAVESLPGSGSGNLIRDDFVSDNWGGVVGWDATSKTRVACRVEVLDELSPNGKPVLRLRSEEILDNTGRDGMNVKTDGTIGLKNGGHCRFSAYVRTKNVPKGQAMSGIFLHGVPWSSDIRVKFPHDTGGKWVKLSWEGKLDLRNYKGQAQLSLYTSRGLGKDAWIDVAEPFLSGVVSKENPGTDQWKLKPRPGRLTPFEPVLDEMRAKDARMTFYYPGGLKAGGEDLVLRATAGGRTVTASFGADHKATAVFGELPAGRLTLKAELVGAKTGRVHVRNEYRARAREEIPDPTPLKRLNNYVSEIFSRPLENATNSFVLAKETWVYFGFSKPVPGATADVDGEKGVVIYRTDEFQEGMRFLQPGKHTVSVSGVPEGVKGVFSVRTVKPILRCGMHLSRDLNPNFDIYRYGTAFWRRLGLYSGFNMSSVSAKRFRERGMRALRSEIEGRGAEVIMGYGMGSWDPKRTCYDAYLKTVTNNAAYQAGQVMSFDENSIIASVGKHGKINTTEIWWKAFDEGRQINVFFDDGAYAVYGNPTYDIPELSAYVNSGDGRGLIFTEAYFRAVESQAGLDRLIEFLRVQMRGIRKAYPAAASRYSYLLSGWTMSGAWSPWCFTDLDMRAMLGEVCRVLATDPEFADNGGITFSTPACWEDFWRCISAGLIRHYCIEGRTDDFGKLNGLRLFPGHIRNGDFLNGFDGWTLEPAEPGSIVEGEKRDYGERWQGRRYPAGYKAKNKIVPGDRFAALTRSAKAPNRLHQKLVGLEPGRVYQVVFTASDRENVETNFLLGNTPNADCRRRKCRNPTIIRAEVEGAETITDLCHSYTNFAKYGIGQSRTSRVVFRAASPEAEVVFSDWKTDTDPGVESGSVTWLNFIMVHPYYHRDEAELETLKELFRTAHNGDMSSTVRVWGQPAGMPRSADFSVRVDGIPVDVLETPMPQNRLKRHNRAPYGYTAFESAGRVTVDVMLVSDAVRLSDIKVLPAKAGVKVVKTGARSVRFTLPGPGNYVFEPAGRHRTLVMAVYPPRTGKEPMESGNGVVYIGPGIHRRPLTVVGSGQTLYLEEGAVLEGAVSLSGKGARLCGRGIVSGAPWPWQKGPNKSADGAYFDHMVQVTGEDVQVKDVTLWSPWTWTLALDSVAGAVVENVKIAGGRVINDDGIDICRSKNVVVRNCFVRTQDDCIAVKWWGENIQVTNCVLWTDSANIARIGWECEKPPKRIGGLRFSGNDILHVSTIPNRPVDFWCNAVFLLQAVNGLTISDVVIENSSVHEIGSGDAFFIAKTMTVDIPEFAARGYRAVEPGHIRGVKVRNMVLPRMEPGPAVLLESHDPGHEVADVVFENVANTAALVRSTANGSGIPASR